MNSHNEHIEQDKHLNDPNNDETILTHISGISDFLKLKQPIKNTTTN